MCRKVTDGITSIYSINTYSVYRINMGAHTVCACIHMYKVNMSCWTPNWTSCCESLDQGAANCPWDKSSPLHCSGTKDGY
jgi:hypothetical protein